MCGSLGIPGILGGLSYCLAGYNAAHQSALLDGNALGVQDMISLSRYIMLCFIEIVKKK